MGIMGARCRPRSMHSKFASNPGDDVELYYVELYYELSGTCVCAAYQQAHNCLIHFFIVNDRCCIPGAVHLKSFANIHDIDARPQIGVFLHWSWYRT